MTDWMSSNVMKTEWSCAFCHNPLLTIHKDGSVDIHPKASVGYEFNLDSIVKMGEKAVSGEVAPSTAKCERIICKIKRWWRSR